MNQNSIGELIFAIRNKKKITQSDVCQGLCTRKDLSKFEGGVRKPDIFLLNALLQRMGTSTDKLELFASEREYSLLELRHFIEEDILSKRYEDCLRKLAVLEHYKESKLPLHKQFILKVQSFIEMSKNENAVIAMQYAEEALKITLPEYSKELVWDKRIHLEELLLLLMVCYYHYLLGGEEKSISQLRKLKYYVEKQYTGWSEKVKIYPQVVYLLVKCLEGRGEYSEMISCCKQSIALQMKDGQMLLLPELMELQSIGLKQVGDKQEYNNTCKQLYYLKEVLRENGYNEGENFVRLFICRRVGTLYSLSKEIRKNRERLGVSQEELSYGICSSETLSRIESGKRTPRLVSYYALMEKLQRSHEICSLLLEVDDFEVLEWKAEIERLSTLRRYKEVRERLVALERELNIDSPKNKQYLLSMNTICSIELGEIELEIALNQMKEALSYTLTDFAVQDIKKVYLFDMEIHILVVIAAICYRMNHTEEAVEILEALLDNFQNNASPICNFYISSVPIRINLTRYLEETDALHKSIQECDEGIRVSLRNYSIRTVDEFLTNKAYALERMDEIEGNKSHLEICQKYYRQAFHLSSILQHDFVNGVIKDHYEITYKEEIM